MAQQRRAKVASRYNEPAVPPSQWEPRYESYSKAEYRAIRAAVDSVPFAWLIDQPASDSLIRKHIRQKITFPCVHHVSSENSPKALQQTTLKILLMKEDRNYRISVWILNNVIYHVITQ